MALVKPHGGRLVERRAKISESELKDLFVHKADETVVMDAEQIALGGFSPIEGFFCRNEMQGVVDSMRLESGVPWTLPITFNISEAEAENFSEKDTIVLAGGNGEAVALLHVEEKFGFDKNETVEKVYGTKSLEHPGVKRTFDAGNVFVGGKVDLIKRAESRFGGRELAPKETRAAFEQRGWSNVLGFHTRNAIHRSHEFVQMEGLKKSGCDGLFVHPVIGRKKSGDFTTPIIVESYRIMADKFYPKGKVVFSALSTFSRYGGPREAIFTALVRKNYGCSHFVVGRDHTGVRDFYGPFDSHKIFDGFDDLDVVPVKFDEVFYSKKTGEYGHAADVEEEHRLHISGTQIRKMLLEGKMPPAGAMRPEISKMIIERLEKGEEVFVE
ncbi:sulfate adenylyltransferase [Candidatus Peregrinibacteria bacterium CG10_big_fil_rev_8_21_14_0_10_54_7]|nr:MAG: sulfate adenylyltransferase [Candidatus Peregrinibacteria bacterium CG10_big_fil_rev_8_21_14_0_10_54_7]